MIKVTDYISNFLARQGVRDVFMISGGGAMHLNDSIGKHPQLRYICTHHEQAAAIAAEGYARATGRLGVVCVTSGPGGTNTMTGVLGQWLDSVSVLYISGQVKQETTTSSCPGLGLRQLGDQEIDIARIVGSITKYAIMVKDPMSIRYHLEKAAYLAKQGRPGPVWLDIPLDVQASMVDEKKLKGYDFKEDTPKTDKKILAQKVKKVIELLKKSKRPVFLAGQGVGIAGARTPFISLIESLNIPTLTSFCGVDLIPSTHRLSMGRPGTLGSRYANFTLQNADLLISVGTRNNIRQVSYTRGVFARSAKKVIVDIDAAELKKPTVVPDLAICADAKDFIVELRRQSAKLKFPDRRSWLDWCSARKKRYPVVLPEYWKSSKLVNPYCFMQSLTKALGRDAVVVAGDGTACVGLFQAGVVTAKQRLIWNSGCAAMGYDIPASIGACFGLGKKPVVCLAGDGSSQMNLQELQTIAHHKLPIKIFILNNQGYLSIKQTQDSFFEGRRVACDASSGVSFPDMIKIAKAYGLTAQRISNHWEMNKKIKNILKQKGPVLCEVMLTPDQKFAPRVSSARLPDGRMVSKPLEDMYPFLDRKEFLENMLVPEYSVKN